MDLYSILYTMNGYRHYVKEVGDIFTAGGLFSQRRNKDYSLTIQIVQAWSQILFVGQVVPIV